MRQRKCRVLFVIPSLAGGGAERVMVSLLRHLDPMQFELTLAVVDTRGAKFRADVPDYVTVIDLERRRVRQALVKLVRLIWKLRPDVVLSTLGHLNLALAIVRPMLPSATRYLARETAVVSEVLLEYARPRLWAWAYRRFYGRFDRVICQSGDMRNDLIGMFDLPAARSVVINNPVDIDAILTAARESWPSDRAAPEIWQTARLGIHLVAAGRLVPQKGFDILIEAMALARNRELHLTLLGDGPLDDQLQQLAHNRGVGSRIDFRGFQPNPYAYFARADAFVLSSRFEGFPNVVLEALACGTPVLALPAPGGVHEILDDIAGCLVAADMSATSLAEILDRFQPVRIERGAVERFSLPRIVGQYANLLRLPAVVAEP